MNRAETNAAILVMAAFAAGKAVQWKGKAPATAWYDATSLTWDWDHFQYRVKPEPKKIWASITKDGLVLTATSIKPNAAIAYNYREFVEVLEEGS